MRYVSPATLAGKKSVSQHPWTGIARSSNYLRKWEDYTASLINLQNVFGPRCYHPEYCGKIARRKMHAISYATVDAIGQVTYIFMEYSHRRTHTRFVSNREKETGFTQGKCDTSS